MDIFFIHGVNKRRELGHTFAGADDAGSDEDGFSSKYEQELDIMRESLQRCCRDVDLPEPRFCPVYWGGHGARIHFYERSGPRCSALVQSGARRGKVAFKRKGRPLGSSPAASDPELARIADELELIAGQMTQGSVSLLELLYSAPQAVLQTMLAPELEKQRADSSKRRAAGASVALLARRVSEDHALRAALERAAQAGDLELVQLLQAELSRSNGPRAQGAGSWALTTMLRLASGVISSKIKSDATYLHASRFFGDSVNYFAGRGTHAEPGVIIQDVRKQIEEHLRRSPRTGPTVFVTHSLGGALFYDLFTYFMPELRFDLWVSVGTQLSYYEDVKLLARSSETVGGYFGREIEGVSRKVVAPLPAGASWYNVFDARDPLAFAAQEVFENARDLQVRLDESSIFAIHTAYFRDPHFYEGLMQAFAKHFGKSVKGHASSLFEIPMSLNSRSE